MDVAGEFPEQTLPRARSLEDTRRKTAKAASSTKADVPTTLLEIFDVPARVVIGNLSRLGRSSSSLSQGTDLFAPKILPPALSSTWVQMDGRGVLVD